MASHFLTLIIRPLPEGGAFLDLYRFRVLLVVVVVLVVQIRECRKVNNASGRIGIF